jgi:hypothetical protein
MTEHTCKMKNHNIAEEMRWDKANQNFLERLENIIEACDKAELAARRVLSDAGIKAEDVNSMYIMEAQAIAHHAKKLLQLYSGQYTWAVADKPPLVPKRRDGPKDS